MTQAWPPKKNAAFDLYFTIRDADGDLVSAAVALDSEISKDNGVFADCTNEAVEIGTSGVYRLQLTATEMNADAVVVIVKTSTAGAKTAVNVIYTVESTWDEGIDVKTGGIAAASFAAGAIDAAAFAQAAADKVWSSATRTLSAFSTALALSVWDVLESAVAVASSMGLKVKTNLDVKVSTRVTGGAGALTRTIGIMVSGNPLEGASVWVATDAAGTNIVAGPLVTNSSGVVTVLLDAGSYYVWVQKDGYVAIVAQAITLS